MREPLSPPANERMILRRKIPLSPRCAVPRAGSKKGQTVIIFWTALALFPLISLGILVWGRTGKGIAWETIRKD